MIQGENYTVHIGNNLDILPTLQDCSVDSIVTDPPYELGFMGKKWDNTGIAYNIDLWRECLRVLKPGGHLLSFGGTRTWHRVAVAIEDAGFEVRDSIAWMYGSGFPKSLDVSKAIDKRGGKTIGWFGQWLKDWREENNVSQKEVAALFLSKTGNLTGCVANWELGLNLPTAEQFTKICRHFDLPFDSLEQAEREIVGTKISGIANREEKERHTIGASKAVEVDITSPATPEAKQWEGWGTALKPAFEPIVVARKPLIGTVAENVLTYGTGGLNIHGSRIATSDSLFRKSSIASPENQSIHDGYQRPWKQDPQKVAEANERTQEKSAVADRLGRWPANVILDEYSAELLDEQSGVSKSPSQTKMTNSKSEGYGFATKTVQGHNDTGGASRFFYVAKASKRDRNEGLENLPEITAAEMVDREQDSAGMNSPRAGAGRTSGAKNFHPTVKPTDLMRYLIKLITPPNGTVLDPFTGSGSTGKAAILEGFRFIGIEMTEDYIPIIEGRLKHAADQRSEGLF